MRIYQLFFAGMLVGVIWFGTPNKVQAVVSCECGDSAHTVLDNITSCGDCNTACQSDVGANSVSCSTAPTPAPAPRRTTPAPAPPPPPPSPTRENKFCCECWPKEVIPACDGTRKTIDGIYTAAQTACNTQCNANSGGANCVSTLIGGDCSQITAGSRIPAAIGFGTNPLCPDMADSCSLPVILGRIIKVALGISGSLALVMFVYGGFIWMVGGQQGAEKKVRYAKEIIVWSTLGLLVIFAAYIIVNTLINAFTS